MTYGLVAAGAGAVIGGAIAAHGSQSAAGKQAAAANQSAQIQNDQWRQTQAQFAPYEHLGNGAITPLLQAMGYNTTLNSHGYYDFNGIDGNNMLQQRFSAPTAAEAAQTPGYQFTLDQGLKSVQNSAAARGLGTSGAAMKGASSYATGLADSTYNDVYQRALSTFNTNYTSAANNVNRLQGLVSNGQNAAGALGTTGAATSGNIANTLMSGANASAAGTVGAANAAASGFNSLGNNALIYGLTQNNAAKTGGASGYNGLLQNDAGGSGYQASLDALNGSGSKVVGL